jgi:uncharacterized protein VirK/YbjX
MTNSSPIQNSAVRWPDAAAALGPVYARAWHRRLKYALRRLLTTRGRGLVLDHVNCSVAARSLLAQAPRAFYPVMHKHLDRRFSAQQRARTMMESMRCMERVLGTDDAARLFAGEQLTLAVLPDTTRVCLNLNRLTFHEGLWAIDLTRADGLRLYTISFGWLDVETLMLACVQGPPREIDGLQCVRELTDAAHGLRPGHLLMFILRTCAAAWQVRRIVGVDEAFQVKGRWNHKAVERRFDYPTFWTESAGVVGGDGNWELPVSLPQRALEEVPSKRRAMYRRRYAMLESLARGADQVLGSRSPTELVFRASQARKGEATESPDALACPAGREGQPGGGAADTG